VNAERSSLLHHVPQDSLRPGSAVVADPPWPSFDVVHRVDYERAIEALKDVLDAAEHAGSAIEESEEWFARRDYARIIVEKAV
jgi:hypothetical protein